MLWTGAAYGGGGGVRTTVLVRVGRLVFDGPYLRWRRRRAYNGINA